MQIPSVDLPAIAKRTKTADHAALTALRYAKPIAYYRTEALRQQNHAGTHAAAAANHYKNADYRVLICFVALARLGFLGVLAAEDFLSMTIRRATGGKMADRTLRRALARLEADGMIKKRQTATGKLTRSGNACHACRINRIIFSPEILAIAGMSEIAHRRPKRPTEKRTNKQTEPVKQALSVLTRGTPRAEKQHARPSLSNVPHEKTKSQQGKFDSQTPCQTPPPVSTPIAPQSQRAQILPTWTAARTIVMHELRRLKLSQTAISIAEIQTSPSYPAIFPQAAQWNQILPLLPSMPTAYRRRAIAREIVPDLLIFSAMYEPDAHAGADQTAAAIAARAHTAAARNAIRCATDNRIDRLFEFLPAETAAELQDARAALRFFPAVVLRGRATPDDLPDAAKKICEIYDRFNTRRAEAPRSEKNRI